MTITIQNKMAPITERSQRVSFKYGNVRFVATPFTAWKPAKAARTKPRCAELDDFQRAFNELHFTSKRLPEELGRYDIAQVFDHHIEDKKEFDRFIAQFAARFGYTAPEMFALGPKETIMLIAKIVASHYKFHFPSELGRMGRYNNRFLDVERVGCYALADNFSYFFDYFKARNSALMDTFIYRFASGHGGHAWNMLISLRRNAKDWTPLEAHFTWIDIVAPMRPLKKVKSCDITDVDLAASPVEGHDMRVFSRLPLPRPKSTELWGHHPFDRRLVLAFFMDPAFFSPVDEVRRSTVKAAMAMIKAGKPLDASTILSLITLFQNNGTGATLQNKLALREYYRLNKSQYTPEERDLINKDIRYV